MQARNNIILTKIAGIGGIVKPKNMQIKHIVSPKLANRKYISVCYIFLAIQNASKAITSRI